MSFYGIVVYVVTAICDRMFGYELVSIEFQQHLESCKPSFYEVIWLL